MRRVGRGYVLIAAAIIAGLWMVAAIALGFAFWPALIVGASCGVLLLTLVLRVRRVRRLDRGD